MLPLIALLLLGVVQVAVVAARQVAVTHAAREAARAAAAGAADGDARQAALSAAALDPSRLNVTIVRQEGDVRAAVTFHDPTDVPLVGPLIPDVALVASASFRKELDG